MTTGPIIDQFRSGGMSAVGVDGVAWVRDCKKKKESITIHVRTSDILLFFYIKKLSAS